MLRFPVYGREERTQHRGSYRVGIGSTLVLILPLAHGSRVLIRRGAAARCSRYVLRGLLVRTRGICCCAGQMEDPHADSGGGAAAAAAAAGPAVQVADICWPPGSAPLRLLEWKVKPGSLVNVDSVLALCAPLPQEKGAEPARLPEKKVKSDRAGVVKELCCQLGQVISPG